MLLTLVNSLSSYLRPLIYSPRTNHLIFSYGGSSAQCVFGCVCVGREACGCRQIRQTEVGVSLGGGGRCGLTLSRHETQIFRSGTPHETPGQLWRTSAEYGLINQRKLRGGEGSCRGLKDTQRGVKWERCKRPLRLCPIWNTKKALWLVTLQKNEKTRMLYLFMNTGFVSMGSKNYLEIICVHMNKNSQMSYFHGAKTNCSD